MATKSFMIQAPGVNAWLWNTLAYYDTDLIMAVGSFIIRVLVRGSKLS